MSTEIRRCAQILQGTLDLALLEEAVRWALYGGLMENLPCDW